MTRVTSSTHTEGQPEADGRTLVRETHTTDDGEAITFEWLREGQDISLVLQARADELNRQYEAKEAAEAVIVGTRIPLSRYEFRQLFGDKRVAIDAFNAAFESHPGLTTEQKALIRTGLEDFRQVAYIRRPFEASVLQMVGLYESLGLLTQAEADTIRAAGS